MEEERPLKKETYKCSSKGNNDPAPCPEIAIRDLEVCAEFGRQRIVQLGGGAKKSVFSVAQRYLPGELLGRVRMVKGGVKKRTKRVKRTAVPEE